MASMLITILVFFLIFGLIWWAMTLIPIPQPFATIGQVILAIIMIIILATYLIPFVGSTSFGQPYHSHRLLN